jgi:hypothetical protein
LKLQNGKTMADYEFADEDEIELMLEQVGC